MAAVTQEAQIEQFLREGAGATGRAAADLVERAVSAPGLFAFGELLDLDGVQRLAADPSLAGHLALLKLFAHGTLPEYRAAVAAGEPLPALTPAQELKLKKLKVATLRRFGFRSKPPAPNAGGFAPDPIIVGGAFSNDPKRAAGRRASRSVRGTTRGAE